MDQLTQHIELFEAYQAKLLDESAILEFEARLNSDSEFRKAFQDFLSIEEGLKEHYKREFKSKFKELDKQLDIDLDKRSKSNIKKIILFSSAIAASICMLFIGYSYYQTQKNIEIAKEYWPVEPGLPVKMSSKGKYDEAMNAYKLGEFSSSVSFLNKIPSDTSYYFQGVIAFEQKDKAKAKQFFNQIDKSSTYHNTAQFRLGLIFLSEGNLGSAKKIFKAQMAEKTEFAEASEEILKKI
jgi:TolA-binding protein